MKFYEEKSWKETHEHCRQPSNCPIVLVIVPSNSKEVEEMQE